ncbi:MAG TPA: glycosyltransferase family 2 protein [Candidatus Limnocylindrales bacterium]
MSLPANPDPLVVVVVVNYEGLEDTVACVESLLAQDYPARNVVVVDNGSRIDEALAIRARFGRAVHAIRSHTNGGYGAGANVGIRWALAERADYVWVLNNDTLVQPSTLRRLVESLERDPEIGIASPQIRAPEGPDAPHGVWYAGGVVSLERGQTRHHTDPLPDSPVPVDTGFITGCAPFIRRAVLETVGLFWEPLFLFWEDTDLCLRAQAAGWRTCVIPSAWIFHRVHGSTSDATVARYHYRNALLVVRRNGTTRQVVLAIASTGMLMARLWAAAALRRRPWPTAATAGFLSGLRSLVRREARRLPVPVTRRRP